MKKITEIMKKKWIRDTSKTIILVFILFIAFISINILIQKLDIPDIDVTRKSIIYPIRSIEKTSKRY